MVGTLRFAHPWVISKLVRMQKPPMIQPPHPGRAVARRGERIARDADGRLWAGVVRICHDPGPAAGGAHPRGLRAQSVGSRGVENDAQRYH
jgi:hypothetical protein